MKNILELYDEYHVRRGDERLQLFEILRDEYSVNSCLYPGCFVHITPAFVFQKTAFVDTDRRAQRFFEDPSVAEFVDLNKQYGEASNITFFAQEYSKPLPIDTEYDLLLSQYAGFVSEKCKKYLRKGGILVANNSHGDASLASIDADFRFRAVINRREERFWFAGNQLHEYFVPRRNVEVTKELLYKLKRGIGYTRSASNYVFEKVS